MKVQNNSEKGTHTDSLFLIQILFVRQVIYNISITDLELALVLDD